MLDCYLAKKRKIKYERRHEVFMREREMPGKVTRADSIEKVTFE